MRHCKKLFKIFFLRNGGQLITPNPPLPLDRFTDHNGTPCIGRSTY